MSEVLIPKNENGKDMSPVEVKTGVVLSIWAPGDGRRNRHHPHFYKRNYMNGPREIETRAVRLSRVQYVLANLHNGSPRAYHSHFDGTVFPRDEAQSFGITVLNCAGYIAPFVVDMTGDKPEIVETTPEMRETLHRPGILSLERGFRTRTRIGQFLMYHAAKQNFHHESQSRIAQFLEYSKPKYRTDEQAQEVRLEIGLRLANVGLGVAVNGIDKTYFKARDEQVVAPTAPVCAWQVAKNMVSGFEPDYFDHLAQNLTEQFEAA